MLSPFEASLMRILINNVSVAPDQIGQLLEHPRSHGRELVHHAVQMRLVDGRRLCHLLCQYWEKPMFDVSFPYRRFLGHFNRPIAELLDHDLLPVDFGSDVVTVVSYYVPDDEILRTLGEKFGKPLHLYLAQVDQVLQGIKLLRARMERFQRADVVDCGTDKKRFVRLVKMGWPAVVRETFAGSTILIEHDRSGTLSKTLESMDPSEPAQLVHYLVGKAMIHRMTEGEAVSNLVESFSQSVPKFEGELKEAILKLRLAPMLLEEEKQEIEDSKE